MTPRSFLHMRKSPRNWHYIFKKYCSICINGPVGSEPWKKTGVENLETLIILLFFQTLWTHISTMSGCSEQSKCTMYVLFMLLVNAVAIAMVVIGAINTGRLNQSNQRNQRKPECVYEFSIIRANPDQLTPGPWETVMRICIMYTVSDPVFKKMSSSSGTRYRQRLFGSRHHNYLYVFFLKGGGSPPPFPR